MAVKKPQDLAPLVKKRIGLIVGPSATLNPAYLPELNRHLRRELKVEAASSNFLDTGEAFVLAGGEERRVREVVRQFTDAQKASPALPQLAEARLNAVLSLALDRNLETALQEYADKNPGQPKVAAINDLRTLAPLKSLPVFKLLGSTARDDFACTRTAYIERKSAWRTVIRTFADANKGAPVLCLGVTECDWLFLELLGEMRADPVALPNPLLMLNTEPISRSPAIERLLGQGRLLLVNGTAGELIRAGYEARAASRRSIAVPGVGVSGLHELADRQEAVKIVNLAAQSGIAATEQQRLLSLLFSPSLPSWDPFVHGLDFPRDITADVLLECREAGLAGPGDSAIVVLGAASCGKTTVLKRAALDLAKQGETVLWLKPWDQPDGRRTLADFFKALASVLGAKARKIVLFVDDPPTLGTITVADALSAAAQAGLELIVVAGVRSSDWDGRDQGYRTRILGSLPPRAELLVPNKFTAKELAAFPAYLLKLNAAVTLADAERMTADASQRSASDILATLWWLLPETRSHIAESVREEYFRLGDLAGLSKVIVGKTEATSELLQKAYRMVAVAETFRLPLPLEVLVSALGVDYAEWLAIHGAQDGAFGLLYMAGDESSPDGELSETLQYRTRSSVVADIIVAAVNGGTISHGGELAVLRSLLAACGGTQPVYREFCVGILMSLERYEWLDFAEGLRLFESAMSALPFADRTLVHQKAIWIRKKGRDPLTAITVLKEALVTANYPSASRGERDEHIFTSLASATLDGMQLLRIDFDAGKAQVMGYLAKARSATFFNPSAAHVQASLVLTLSDTADRTQAADYFQLLNTALADIDRALVMLRAPRAYRPELDQEDRQMLTVARMQLLSRAALSKDLLEEADDIWTRHHSQDGFVFVARHLLQKAGREKDSGADFRGAFEYVQSKMALVSAAGAVPSPGLHEVALHIYYRWRVQRDGKPGGIVDWEVLRHHADQVLKSQRTQDPLYLYVEALALAHLGRWGDAQACFTALRRQSMPPTILYVARDCLLDANGNARTVQGTVRRTGENVFVSCDDPATAIRAERKSQWPGDGKIVHTRIDFSFAGPTAVLISSG